ncbi:MAG: amino acid adenylation domain-containing protein, partial [Blastocatellia bacterium]
MNLSNKAREGTLPTGFVHEWFEEQASRTPDAVAVVFGEDQLSYGELDRLANQLANYLIAHGVRTDVSVSVCVEPSVDIAIALLAVLKAGGAYVPLDPGYPLERLEVILDDNKPTVILTQTHLLPKLPKSNAHVFCFDRDTDITETLSVEKPKVEIDGDQTAYIVYTSGTTGTPKGVMASYTNLAHYIHVAREMYGFDASTIMPAMARFTFSITFFELLNPLAAGGTLVLLKRDDILDIERLAKAIERFTVVHASPSLWRKLLGHIEQEGIELSKFDGLKHVSTGGDLVPPDVLEAMKRVFRKSEVFVIYGCSEVSCMACTNFISRETEITKTLVGQPFHNVSIRICDEDQYPLAAGEAGEVYISGAGLTKGYLNQPDLTQEKFQFFDGQLFYRTGDRGRLDEEGRLEILGRTDFQIKLRGIRIEPAEIEIAMRRLPGIHDSVVALRKLPNGDDGLIGYLVFEPADAPDIAQIRCYLQSKLPDYMIPSAYVVLDSLPVNMNLKVDRKALPDPEQGNILLSEQYVVPRNEVERMIAEIWSEVLGIDRIGVIDDFFGLGGHSLLATQVISRIRNTFHVDLSVGKIFETPTVASLAEYVNGLPKISSNEDTAFEIKVVNRDQSLPLSFAQQRLWFLDKLDPNSAVYNLPLGMRMSGKLDITLLKKALDGVIERHESLRTTFETVDGKPYARISSSLQTDLPLIDIRDLPEPERESGLHQHASEEAGIAFDLSVVPLFRASMVRLQDNEHVMLITLHHIISDGWSLAVFFKELTEAYEILVNGNQKALNVPSIQYADFAAWQQDYLREDVLRKQTEYWKNKLKGAPALLELPTDHSRPAIQSHKGANYPVTISPEIVESLKVLSRREGVTLYMTMLAAFQTLLYRHTNQEDITVGTPIANRNRVEIEDLIGFFANTLALRTDLSGDPTFRDLLSRVKKVTLEAYEYQDIPFEKLVEELNPERSLSHNPIFQVLFGLHNTPPFVSGASGLKYAPIEISRNVSRFDLSLDLFENENGISGMVEYSNDLFTESSISKLMDRFQVLLKSISEEANSRISSIQLLPENESRQLLKEWNETGAEYPKTSCLHHLFEEYAKETPDAIAVVYEKRQLTYAELDCRANILATYLRSLSPDRNPNIGLCIDRSLEMIVGMLAILKAGGAYVPLDPTYPAERLAFMIEDAGAEIILTREEFIGSLPTENVRTICIDREWDAVANESSGLPMHHVEPVDLAYVIYTSGSTGKPKGVQVRHQSVVNLVTTSRPVFDFGSNDVWTVFHSFSFDLSVWEIWTPLTSGGRLVIVPLEVSQSPKDFHELLVEQKVTVLNQTPSAMRQLAGFRRTAKETAAGNLSLRVIFCGGEALPREVAACVLEWGVPFWNLYGPTEATVWAAAGQVTNNELKYNLTPVGRPLPNVKLYVLDNHLNPVPTGVNGELFIGGLGLAKGYLNRTELTNESFVADPFRSESEGRLYRTGDLVRYLADGRIEYIGRMDSQVKVRGFRIELGDVEAPLNEHPSIHECVVDLNESENGDRSLVAYYVQNGGGVVTARDLRKYLSKRLPSYMTPTHFVALERLPLTPNGKVDRKALPEVGRSGGEEREGYEAPRDETEEKLAGI